MQGGISNKLIKIFMSIKTFIENVTEFNCFRKICYYIIKNMYCLDTPLITFLYLILLNIIHIITLF